MLYSRTRLESGIRVLTENMPEIRSVALGFWVGAGSRDEPREIQGAAHFLEHLLFKGTDRYGPRAIAEAFDAVGGEANAFSTKEYTCVYARVLDRDLPMALDILVDMLTQPTIGVADVESERKVILEEIAMHEDTPDDLVHDVLMEAVFEDHPLAREVMGTVESVSSISRESLAGFHADYYIPVNVVVSAVGSVDHDQFVSRISSAFGGAEGSKPARQETAVQSGKRLVVMNRPTEQTHLVLGGVGLSRHHPDRYIWGVLDTLLGGGMSSRLFQEVRENRGLAYSVYSYRNLYSETGLWGAYAGTSPSNARDVVKLILDELDRLVDAGITQEELDRAKGHTRGGIVLGLEDPTSRMSRLGKSELVHGEILSVDEIVARVDAVSLEDVWRVARDLLDPENRALAVIGPFKEDDFSDLL